MNAVGSEVLTGSLFTEIGQDVICVTEIATASIQILMIFSYEIVVDAESSDDEIAIHPVIPCGKVAIVCDFGHDDSFQ